LQIAYDALISTIPLDTTLRWLGKSEWADGLTHSSSHIVGIGEHPSLPSVCLGLLLNMCSPSHELLSRLPSALLLQSGVQITPCMPTHAHFTNETYSAA
jgi:protoporphyrinogen oxidase